MPRKLYFSVKRRERQRKCIQEWSEAVVKPVNEHIFLSCPYTSNVWLYREALLKKGTLFIPANENSIACASPTCLTHVERDSDDVQRHSGVCDAAEWGRLDGRKVTFGKKEKYEKKNESHKLQHIFLQVCSLTLSILEALGFRRRRRCRLIRREELCSVELLNLNTRIQYGIF